MSKKLRPRRTPKLSSPLGHMTGLVVFVGGCGMLTSAGVDAVMGGKDAVTLAISGVVVGLPGFVLWRFSETPQRITTGQIFATVTASWIALSLAATIPYLATGSVPRFDNALFESVAGFTTTGATILAPIENLGPGILFWRAMTQWLGGMGVIVLAVAVLPFAGVGGLGLLSAEAPGPSSERLAPRVRETAQRLWLLYVVFTGLVAVAYLLAGMGSYDAIAHSFTTVSTGGFSPYDASLAHFASAAVDWVAIVAMFVAGGSFALYWHALRGRPDRFLRSTEARVYVLLVGGIALASAAWNALGFGFSHDIVRGSILSVVSLTSTTGYTTLDYTQWTPAVQLLLLFGMAVGGMTGSTAGGLKVFRLLAVLGFARGQGVRQLHPNAVHVVRFGDDAIPHPIVDRTVGFFGFFMATGAVATFVVAAFGSDMITAISSTVATLANVGPGLGDVGPSQGHFLAIAAPGRFVLMLTMLIGRLEIFPVFLSAAAVYRAAARVIRKGRVRRAFERSEERRP